MNDPIPAVLVVSLLLAVTGLFVAGNLGLVALAVAGLWAAGLLQALDEPVAAWP
jgi:hypothetical protein